MEVGTKRASEPILIRPSDKASGRMAEFLRNEDL
jgi:hypothetical protein